mgnify:CR=1 FL=1
MRVFLVHKFNPGLVFEVLEYDKAKHSAELRTRHGAQVTDPCFSLDELKAEYELTTEPPDCFKGE